MPKTKFTKHDYEEMHKLARETVVKLIGQDMIDEWESLGTLVDNVWEDRFYQAIHSTMREYFDWFDGEHQDCPYCHKGQIVVGNSVQNCPVCQGRGWLD